MVEPVIWTRCPEGVRGTLMVRDYGGEDFWLAGWPQPCPTCAGGTTKWYDEDGRDVPCSECDGGGVGWGPLKDTIEEALAPCVAIGFTPSVTAMTLAVLVAMGDTR